MTLDVVWPSEFKDNVLDFSTYEYGHTLAIQLCAWGNVMFGAQPPDNFFEVMDAASKLTGAFTPEQCSIQADILMMQRKNKKDDDED